MEKVKTPLLDELRKGANEEYIASKENVLKTIPQEVTNLPCVDCDINFLTRIRNKSTLTDEEFNNLICINTSDCDKNVEFSEFYNEVLFSSIDRNPTLFYKSFSNPKLKQFKTKVMLELENPVGDNISAGKTLLKVKESLKRIEPDGRRRQLNLELQRDLDKIINLRQE